MKPLEGWTCQRAENLKKSSKIPKNNYAATMVSAARRQIIGGGGRSTKVRGGAPQISAAAARPAHGSISYDLRMRYCSDEIMSGLFYKEIPPGHILRDFKWWDI